MAFRTEDGIEIPALTTEQMREVDRIAVEEYRLDVLQMMENAGRNLALNVIEMLENESGEVTVLAGSGGNGGGGLCCARHLHNRGWMVNIVLAKDPDQLSRAASNQLHTLRLAGLEPSDPADAARLIQKSQLVVDALIGYSLRGAPEGRSADLIQLCNRHARQTLSLDVPSGMNSTTGEIPGVVVHADRILTLALPKTGLHNASGELYLADIGIPPELYQRLGLKVSPFFGQRYWLRLLVEE